MRYLYLLIFMILAQSCATILNKKTQSVTIQTDTIRTVIINNTDTLKSKKEYSVKFERSKTPIKISLLDTSNRSKDYLITPRFSNTLALNVWNYGVGFIVDYFTPKRFAYPNYIYLEDKKTEKNQLFNKYHTYQKTYQKDLFIGFGIPIYNNFTSNNALNQSDFTENAFGISLFLDYYYLKNTFFSLKLSQQNVLYGIEDSFYFYSKDINKNEYQAYQNFLLTDYIIDAASTSLTISNGHQFKKIQLNYGFGLTRYYYTRYLELNFSPTITNFIYHENQVNVDLLFSTYYLLGKHMNLGLIYRPSILSLTNNSPQIRNSYFGIDLMFRFKTKFQKK
jgi:hypothetical protein